MDTVAMYDLATKCCVYIIKITMIIAIREMDNCSCDYTMNFMCCR